MRIRIVLVQFVLILKSLAYANFSRRSPSKLFFESIYLNEIRRGGIPEGVDFSCNTMDSEELFSLKLNDYHAADKLLTEHRLVFVVHGWRDEANSGWVRDIQTTWRRYQDANICTVDWRKFSGRDYKTAMLKTFRVGITLADMVQWLESYRGFHRDDIILVGYSLGSHAVGFAGSRLNGQIGEIIALDPAGPLFTMPYDIGAKYRLDETDAKFIQVLHTSGGTLGTDVKCGHADFYPNGGATPQTNCIFPAVTDEANKNPIGCSHSAAVKFFKISMNPEYPFTGWDCSHYQNFKLGLCQHTKRSTFGIHSKRRSGDFYFTTQAHTPYVEAKRKKKRKPKIKS